MMPGRFKFFALVLFSGLLVSGCADKSQTFEAISGEEMFSGEFNSKKVEVNLLIEVTGGSARGVLNEKAWQEADLSHCIELILTKKQAESLSAFNGEIISLKGEIIEIPFFGDLSRIETVEERPWNYTSPCSYGSIGFFLHDFSALSR